MGDAADDAINEGIFDEAFGDYAPYDDGYDAEYYEDVDEQDIDGEEEKP